MRDVFDILPCPYCGGAVDMVKVSHKDKNGRKGTTYRIKCTECKATAIGNGFANESQKDSNERIRQYEDFLAKY